MNRKTVIFALALAGVAGGAYVARPRHADLRGFAADDPSLLTSGIGRAEAMAYRDEIGEAMTDSDRSEVECRLRRAYWSLKAAVAGGDS